MKILTFAKTCHPDHLTEEVYHLVVQTDDNAYVLYEQSEHMLNFHKRTEVDHLVWFADGSYYLIGTDEDGRRVDFDTNYTQQWRGMKFFRPEDYEVEIHGDIAIVTDRFTRNDPERELVTALHAYISASTARTGDDELTIREARWLQAAKELLVKLRISGN